MNLDRVREFGSSLINICAEINTITQWGMEHLPATRGDVITQSTFKVERVAEAMSIINKFNCDYYDKQLSQVRQYIEAELLSKDNIARKYIITDIVIYSPVVNFHLFSRATCPCRNTFVLADRLIPLNRSIDSQNFGVTDIGDVFAKGLIMIMPIILDYLRFIKHICSIYAFEDTTTIPQWMQDAFNKVIVGDESDGKSINSTTPHDTHLFDQLLINDNKEEVVARIKTIPEFKGKRVGLTLKMLEREGIMHPIGTRHFSKIHRELAEIFGDILSVRSSSKGYDDFEYDQNNQDVASIKSAYFQS